MAWLKQGVVDAVHDAGVRTVRLDRRTAKIWQRHRVAGDPPSFTGWYWHRLVRGRVVESDRTGPFPCWSAAIADAFRVLQLRMKE